MKPFPIVIAAALVVVASIVVFFTGRPRSIGQNESTPNQEAVTANELVAEPTNQPANDPFVQDQPVNGSIPADAPIGVATYRTYSESEFAAAKNSTGKTVLYFHADWCPVCRVLDPNIVANIRSLPRGLTILKVNYDRETELKKQYGVTYQHTFVQVDGDGRKRKLWSGSTDAGAIAEQLL